MKFWELTSAFRSEKDNIRSVLEKPIWAKYKFYFENLNSLVEQQDREALDAEIPFELAYQVCELSKIKFWHYYKRTPHALSSFKQSTKEPFEEISASEILVRFGGSFIEETLERSVSDVMPRPLGNKIEVLASFNLTSIGMLAILRTEFGVLNPNATLCSLDNKKEWVIIKEPLMMVSPYSAQLKMDSQKEQGIRQYLIKPIVGEYKPCPTDLLQIKI